MIRAAGFLVAAAAVTSAWAGLLGGPALWVWAVAAAAALMLAWERLRKPAAVAVLVGWPVGALLAAGVPAGDLWPSRWRLLMAALGEGANRLVMFDPSSATGDPWLAAVWLLLVGGLWLSAAAVAASAPRSTVRALGALILVVLPWVVAAVIRQTDQVSWQGAAILLAALLWFAPGRSAAARPLVVLGVAAALLSTTVAHLFGPRLQWFAIDEMVGRDPQFRTLDPTQTYGPLEGRRTGATMLEVTAPSPGLWRMQTLDRFSWRGWEVGGGMDREDLPEPMAQTVDIDVTVRGLRNDLIVSPGQTVDVQSAQGGKATEAWGDGYRLTPRPKSGDSYRVRANVVTADAETLRAAPRPSNPLLSPYTWLSGRWGGPYLRGQLGEFGAPPLATSDRARRYLPYGRFDELSMLARQLTTGAATQYDVVDRIQRYLTQTGGFRYSTDVDLTSRIPLQDFLLDTKVGYCQHFAGAAALLLRLSGVPTRVVAGFATGTEQDGKYIVRDVDAHAWIEVYFEGVGWVAFNPTPAAADATVDPSLDPLAPPKDEGAGGSSALSSVLVLGLLLVTGPVVAVRLARRRRRVRSSPDALLETLARGVGGRVTPGTTLGELRHDLARIGPRVAAVAGDLERERFAPGDSPVLARPRTQIIKAVTQDLGARRSAGLLLKVVSSPRRPPP